MRCAFPTQVAGVVCAELSHKSRGATLFEVMVALVIVGVAVTAVVEFLASATKANAQLSDVEVALSICRAGHEWAGARSPATLEGNFPKGASEVRTYTPATILGAANTTLYDSDSERANTYHGWTQVFTGRRVSEDNLSQADSKGTSKCFEVTVQARKNGGTVAHLTRLYMLP